MMNDVDQEDYYPPTCLHCDGRLSSVTLEKTYNWNQSTMDYDPDNYEFVFICPHCHGEVGEKLEDGTHKWYTPIDFGNFAV